MSDVKDKVVTVESLLTLHEHNKETYVANTDIIPIDKGGTDATDIDTARANLGAVGKSGDNMTGSLIFDNNVGIKAKDSDETEYNLMHLSADNELQLGYGLPDEYPMQINPMIKLSSNNYGTELPVAGIVGRLFFKKVTE